MLQGNIHLNIKPVQRNKGQSIVARVAYQTASSIRDPRTGEWHNYRYKKNELGLTHLILPKVVTANIPEYKQFWVNLEAHYKRGNSVPARTASLALPVELSPDENHELMLQYGHWLSDMYGVAVQVTSHKPHSSNPHFHLAITACTVMGDGSFGKKAIALDPISAQRELKQRIAPVEILRLQWADMVNAAFEKAGISERVDHRSYLRRGIQEIPQKHEGVWRHSSQNRVLGCPKEYNKNIETVNEVLHHDRREFQKNAITHNSSGETATRGVGSNQDGTDRNQARHAPDALNYGQPAQRSEDAYGKHGRDSLGYGGRYQSAIPGEVQPENSGRCHHESEQSADFYELTHDSTGNVDSIGDKGFSDLIIPQLFTVIAALELETLRLSYSILRHESRRAKVPLKLPASGIVDVVAQEIMLLMTTLKTEVLRLQNKSSDLWLRTCPKIVLPGANITNIVSVPLSRLTHTLAPVSAGMAFRIENLFKYSQEEAEKRHEAARVRGHLESATMPISASNETWHKKLWELLVAKAEQEPASLSKLSRLHNAHIKVQLMFPQVTVSDFSLTLKNFSVRTPEEQGIIIRDLAQRCPAQRPVRVKIPPLPHKSIGAGHSQTPHYVLRAAQTLPHTPVRPFQKSILQTPLTDSIQAMRNLWNKIEVYAEKDGKIYFNSTDGKKKLQSAIEHIWRNNPEIPFEFMQKTIFRCVVSDRDDFERFLQQTYASIAILKDLHDGSDIQQAAVLPHAPHPQSSQGLEDNNGDDSGDSMSFT